MLSVISYLQDAETVVKFQRLCGVIRIDDANVWTPTVPADYCTRVHESNGGVDGHQCERIDNSHTTTGSPSVETSNGNVRSRKTTTLGDGQALDQQINTNGTAATASGNSHLPRGSWQVEDYIVTNRFLYYLFHFGANLGNEIFYMTFFPFWFWNIDGCVGRQLCLFWCIFMYLGQGSKDIVQIPRPPSPPVVQMEKRYALEYGMPSTHAMVGAGIPFAIFFLTKERYIYPYELALIGAITWCLLVSCSRIYLGMHSVLDVIIGLLFVSILMAVFLPYLGAIDDWLIHSSYAPAVSIVVPIVLCLLYPTPSKWSTARGDTILILSSGAGVSLGHWLSFHFGFMRKSTSPPPYAIIPPTWSWAGLIVLRMAIGVIVLLGVRAAVAAVTYRAVCWIAGVDPRDKVTAKHHLCVDLPYKFVTYATLSIGMVYAAPVMFRALGIERETFFTEI